MAFTQTFPFDQSLFPETGNGVCAVLSAHWIQLMREGKNLGPDDRRAKLETAIVKYAPMLQSIYDSNWAEFGELKQKCAWVLRVAGNSNIDDVQYNLRNGALTNYIKDERRTGFHFNFGHNPVIGDRWGHAVGIWRSGHGKGIFASGHMYVFDPNQGEYKGNKSDLSRFIDSRILPQFLSPVSWTYVLKAVRPQKPKGKGILGRRLF